MASDQVDRKDEELRYLQKTLHEKEEQLSRQAAAGAWRFCQPRARPQHSSECCPERVQARPLIAAAGSMRAGCKSK